jgi:ribonucleoside-diphosphate reductase alpha chain
MMQWSAESQSTTTTPGMMSGAMGEPAIQSAGLSAQANLSDIKIIRRNGAVVGFEPSKIQVAMTKAFLAVQGNQGAASARVRELTEALTNQVVLALLRRLPAGGTLHIEDIQDQVELALMRSGEHEVARAYVLYRERRTQERAQERAAKQKADPSADLAPALRMLVDGQPRPLNHAWLRDIIVAACADLGDAVSADAVMEDTVKNLYDGVPLEEVFKSAILAARALVEKDPAYAKVTARLLLHTIRKEILQADVAQAEMEACYREYFPRFIKKGIEIGLLNEELSRFDLQKMAAAIDAKRDLQFDYLGLQTLYDRYFLIDRNDTYSGEGRRIEMPQAFFMRVAMGLALNELIS